MQAVFRSVMKKAGPQHIKTALSEITCLASRRLASEEVWKDRSGGCLNEGID